MDSASARAQVGPGRLYRPSLKILVSHHPKSLQRRLLQSQRASSYLHYSSSFFPPFCSASQHLSSPPPSIPPRSRSDIPYVPHRYLAERKGLLRLSGESTPIADIYQEVAAYQQRGSAKVTYIVRISNSRTFRLPQPPNRIPSDCTCFHSIERLSTTGDSSIVQDHNSLGGPTL